MSVDVVVKIGGGLLAHEGWLDAVLAEVAAASRNQALLVVPGGGPFADAVRDVDRRIRLSDDVAHWVAVLAMDQYAHVIVSRLAGGVLVTSPVEIEQALSAHRVPVLAPSRWLRESDPLPHSWDVTSDSIAAWASGAVGAPRLVLVKPVRAGAGDLVDSYFARALPDGVAAEFVSAGEIAMVRGALQPSA